MHPALTHFFCQDGLQLEQHLGVAKACIETDCNSAMGEYQILLEIKQLSRSFDEFSMSKFPQRHEN